MFWLIVHSVFVWFLENHKLNHALHINVFNRLCQPEYWFGTTIFFNIQTRSWYIYIYKYKLYLFRKIIYFDETYALFTSTSIFFGDLYFTKRTNQYQGFTCWITADTAKRYSNANALDYENDWRISTTKDRTAYIKYILTKIDAKNDRRTWRRLQPRICQTRCCRSELNLPIVMTV